MHRIDAIHHLIRHGSGQDNLVVVSPNHAPDNAHDLATRIEKWTATVTMIDGDGTQRTQVSSIRLVEHGNPHKLVLELPDLDPSWLGGRLTAVAYGYDLIMKAGRYTSHTQRRDRARRLDYSDIPISVLIDYVGWLLERPNRGGEWLTRFRLDTVASGHEIALKFIDTEGGAELAPTIMLQRPYGLGKSVDGAEWVYIWDENGTMVAPT